VRRVDSSAWVMKEGWRLRPCGRDWRGLREREMVDEVEDVVASARRTGSCEQDGGEDAEIEVEPKVEEGGAGLCTELKKSWRVLRFRDGVVAVTDISS